MQRRPRRFSSEATARARHNASVRLAKCTLTIIAGVAAAQTSQSSVNFGSVPSGTATNEVLHLCFRDAINMALRYNLGQIETGENARIARGQWLRALSGLLPQVVAGAFENVDQLSAATLGINIQQVNGVIGPFSFSTAQASASQTLLSFESIQRFRMARSRAGTGLGLDTVQRIVNTGAAFRSAKPGDTRFQVLLPLASAQTQKE